MAIHPDLTAYRAVDACGGTYSTAQEASGYAQGHRDALEAACEAVKKPDALMADLLAALEGAVADLRSTLSWRGDGWECSEDELLGDYLAAIAKARGQ